MKTIKIYFSILAMLSLLLTSCSKDEPTDVMGGDDQSLIEVSFATNLTDLLNRSHLLSDLPVCSDDTPMMASIIVRPQGGNPDGSDDIEVDVAIKGNAQSGYFTAYDEALKLPAGTHTLRSFLVYSDEAMQNLIWLAPVDDGDGPGTLSEYVDNPLPMPFTLYEGEKYYLDVEVLCFDERNVNEYGYQFFDLMPEVIYNFCFFANYCAENGRDYPASYTLDLYYGDDDVNMANNEWILTESNTTGYYNNNGTVTQTPTDRPFAEPLCIAIPNPRAGDTGDYLTYRITLNEWNGVYDVQDDGETVVTGTLSWDDILEYIDPNNDGVLEENIEYLHERINCDDDDTGNGNGNGNGNGGGDEDPEFTCDFSAASDCVAWDFDQSEATYNAILEGYVIMFEGESVGILSIETDDSGTVTVDAGMDFGFLIDDLGVIIDDESEECLYDLGSSGETVSFEGSYGDQTNVQVLINICPANE